MILLPFLFVSLVCGPKTIHQVTPTEEAHINPLHVLCLAVGFVCFVFALDRGGSAVTAVSNGDTSATTQCVIAVVLLLIAMAALLVFAWVSHRAFSPLVRLTVLRSVKFRWHLLAYVLLQFVTIGYGYMIPNASQLGFGASVLAAGVVLLPGALLERLVLRFRDRCLISSVRSARCSLPCSPTCVPSRPNDSCCAHGT